MTLIFVIFTLDEFNIYTREAGGGKLEVSVEGPSKAKLEVVDRGQGYTTVCYVVDRDGRSLFLDTSGYTWILVYKNM